MNNLFISGAASERGGVYNYVNVSGACKITSDVECNEFKCSGASKMEGNVKCVNFHASGASDVSGTVECSELFKCSGATGVGGVDAMNVRMSGASKSRGDVTARREIHTSGSVTVMGNLMAERINGSGSVKVKGNINAESFVFEMSASASNSSAESIGGTLIEIRRKEPEYGVFNSIINSLFNGGSPSQFTVDEIEGDKVSLTGVRARVVRGNDINIGDDCEIERVEYTGKVTYSDTSKIGALVEI